jgi:tripartite-type tricarboxylate transporter receptor subunit TctC
LRWLSLPRSQPTRPIKIIAPFGAGGPGDVLSRQLAQYLSEQFKQSVVVEDRPGAASMIGADAAAPSSPYVRVMSFHSNRASRP